MDKLNDGAISFRKKDFDKHKGLFGDLSNSQKPHTLFIGCSDSRLVPSLITSTIPGELFIIRSVANIIPPYKRGQLSSYQFGHRICCPIPGSRKYHCLWTFQLWRLRGFVQNRRGDEEFAPYQPLARIVASGKKQSDADAPQGHERRAGMDDLTDERGRTDNPLAYLSIRA